jgi:hypothetical protein
MMGLPIPDGKDAKVTTSSPPTFSLIVPTRHRVRQLGELLESLAATTSNLRALEVVLVVDADDAESIAFRFDRVPLKHVVVEPGVTMGDLNTAGYEASSGSYLMLLNDDVIARTRRWDRKVVTCFREVPDGIVLVHPNDTLFRDGMCTFPIVSRTFCELAGGICPRDYVRYRIDDHIEDIFNLLVVLGERRTFYLPDVVFEHQKFVSQPDGGRAYVPDREILAVDAPRFTAQFPERKELALRLKRYIATEAALEREKYWRFQLEQIADYESLRVPGRQLVRSDADRVGSQVVAGLRRIQSCARRNGYAGVARALWRRLVNIGWKRPSLTGPAANRISPRQLHNGGQPF